MLILPKNHEDLIRQSLPCEGDIDSMPLYLITGHSQDVSQIFP